jgi:hypothetical protein
MRGKPFLGSFEGKTQYKQRLFDYLSVLGYTHSMRFRHAGMGPEGPRFAVRPQTGRSPIAGAAAFAQKTMRMV